MRAQSGSDDDLEGATERLAHEDPRITQKVIVASLGKHVLVPGIGRER
jgi:hypothetical protein